MFTNNAFAVAAQQLPAGFMQWYLVLMVLAVIVGTLLDMAHKGSATYFFANWRKSKAKGARQIGGGELVSIAAETALVDVMTSGEFCNPRRRIAHLLTMYGFVIYVVTTAVMVFCYATPATPAPPTLTICAGSDPPSRRFSTHHTGHDTAASRIDATAMRAVIIVVCAPSRRPLKPSRKRDSSNQVINALAITVPMISPAIPSGL